MLAAHVRLWFVVGLRRDLNNPGVLVQSMGAGCLAVIIGACATAGLAGSNWAARSLGGVIIVFGLTLTVLCLRRLRRK